MEPFYHQTSDGPHGEHTKKALAVSLLAVLLASSFPLVGASTPSATGTQTKYLTFGVIDQRISYRIPSYDTQQVDHTGNTATFKSH